MKNRIQKLLHRLLRRDPIVLREPGVDWTTGDGDYMRHFWTTNTGHKLRLMLDDAIFTSAMAAHSQDFISGELALRAYIFRLQSPTPETSAADAEHTTLQEDAQPA